MKKILLVDGFGLIFKSYYAFINRPLTNKDGENTSAVFGFFKSLLSILDKEKPDYYIVALEGKGECFRNKVYPEYKANRPPAPEDLVPQIIKIINLLTKLEMPHISIDEYEADDIIGAASKKYIDDKMGFVEILTSDKDMRQLINEKVKVLHPGRSTDEYKILNNDNLIEEMGITPDQVIDYFALTGDSTDNIPGVKGIGPKTAVQLIEEWGSLDNIYENIDKIQSKSVKEKLANNKKEAYLSKNLFTIEKEIDAKFEWDKYKIGPLNLNNAKLRLEKDSLKSLIDSINTFNAKFDRGTLFDFNNLDNEENKSEEAQNGKELFDRLDKDFLVITDQKDLNEKINHIKGKKIFCFDLETTGFNFINDKIISINFAIYNDVFLLPLHISDTQQEELKIKADENYINNYFNLLRPIFEDETVLKIGHNLKFDIKFLKALGIETKGQLFDTMLAEYCIDASHNILNMDDLAEKYLNYKTIHYKDVIENPNKQTLQDVSIKELTDYACEDADITFKLYEVLKEKINKDEKAKKLFYEIEMPLLRVLIDMEYNGVALDTIYLRKLSKELEIELKELTERLMDMAEENFNPNSTKQVAEILFNKFNLPVIKRSKTGPSTDVDVLTKLSYIHPIASLLLEYRTLSKIKSTYSDSLPQMVNEKTNRIHTTYMQTGTQTGRLSSKDPNLQNIPIRSEIGRKIRRAFIPSEGRILVNADYSQIELFLLAEFSKDENLYTAFKNGEDVHVKTASLIFDKTPDEITKEERSIGKTINFSILYGQGVYRLSENLGISRSDASNFLVKYFTSYAGVKAYMEGIKESTKKTGYAETYWGRRRAIPEIFDQNKMRQANGERIAVNTTFQGTAADLMKISMIRIHNKFREQELKSKLIMQVHDELIFDVVLSEKDRVIEIIKDGMENNYDFSLDLKTSMMSGNNWGELY